MKNIPTPDGKGASRKGGYRGTKMWTTHRLEGANENRATKAVKKPKRSSK